MSFFCGCDGGSEVGIRGVECGLGSSDSGCVRIIWSGCIGSDGLFVCRISCFDSALSYLNSGFGKVSSFGFLFSSFRCGFSSLSSLFISFFSCFGLIFSILSSLLSCLFSSFSSLLSCFFSGLARIVAFASSCWFSIITGDWSKGEELGFFDRKERGLGASSDHGSDKGGVENFHLKFFFFLLL